MATRLARRDRLLLGACFLLVAATAIDLNSAEMYFGTLPALPRIGVPVLLAIGLFGSVLRSNFLRAIGWIGIFCFASTLLLAFPTEDYVLGGPGYPGTDVPRLVGVTDIAWRLAVISALSAALVVCFQKLRIRS